MSKRNRSTGRSNHDVGGDIDVHVLLEMSGVFSRLVPDIFLNIMCRVPLKSLSRCRWVCKAGYKLINTPSFAKIQYEWTVTNNFPCVFFWRSNNKFYLADNQVFDDLDTLATTHNLDPNGFQRNFGENIFHAVGYANGLICFAASLDYDSPCPFYIYNPIIGEHITIPKSPNKYKEREYTAFGFDPTTGEYKVIRLIQHLDEAKQYSGMEGEVYTLGSNEWRKLEDIPPFFNSLQCGIYTNGSLHWYSFLFDTIIGIVAFNVGAEKFNVIQPPPDMPKVGRKRVAVVEECLSVLHNETPCKSYDIWVMKDYGVQSSWVKKYSFSINQLWNLFHCYYIASNNLIKLRDGEFLQVCGAYNNAIICYDTKKEILRSIRLDSVIELSIQFVLQVGSLFSPKDVGISKRKKV